MAYEDESIDVRWVTRDFARLERRYGLIIGAATGALGMLITLLVIGLLI